MPITTRGSRPPAADAPLFAKDSTNIATLTTELLDNGYATQSRPGSANYNWLFNYVSAAALHNMIYGVSVYDDTETFPVHAYTNRNGVLYKGLQGANSGNLPESSPAWWHDIRQPVVDDITTDATPVINAYFDMQFNVDTSSGSWTVNLGAGAFTGQRVMVICSGVGLAYVKGIGSLVSGKIIGVWDGASATGTPVSNDLEWEAVWDGSAWRPINEITADYVSGDFVIKQSSVGDMFLFWESETLVAGFGIGSIFVSNPESTVTFPVAFSAIPTFHNIGAERVSSVFVWGVSDGVLSATQDTLRLASAQSTANGKIKSSYGGTY